jgi:hypothetical protein
MYGFGSKDKVALPSRHRYFRSGPDALRAANFERRTYNATVETYE